MKKSSYVLFLICTLATIMMAYGQNTAPLRLVQTILIPGVRGRIDHMSIDTERQRLFVAALGNGTVEVLDLRSAKVAQSVAGLKEPQGVLYIQELGKLFVATGGDGKCYVYSGDPLRQLAVVGIGEDADNIRYDETGKRIYVGYGSGALAIIDPNTPKRLGEIRLDGHPESFQLERAGSKIYVNVPDAQRISVLDRVKEAVETAWPLKDFRANYPMAFIGGTHRLAIVTRNPPKLMILDSLSGKAVSELNCAGDADDVFYDAGKKLVYVSCGQGFIDVFSERDPDHYQELVRIPTAPGARTSLWVPQLSRFYLAVPARSGNESAIFVYQSR